MWRRLPCRRLAVASASVKACIHVGGDAPIVGGELRPSSRRRQRTSNIRLVDVDATEPRVAGEVLVQTSSSSAHATSTPAARTRGDPTVTAQARSHRQPRPSEAEGTQLAPHDPATVVRLDSRRRQLHLSPVQRELIWSARREQYQQMLLRMVTCLQSHLTPIEKCHTLLALHEEVIEKRLRLRADTYDDIFHIFYAVATLGSAAPALDAEEAVGRNRTLASSSLLPAEFASASVAAASLLAGPLLQSLWTMYRYMIDSGTNPTPRIVQHMMGVLERHRAKDPIVEARAHSLMLDLDRFHLPPTEYTVAAYIGVCDSNGAMHLAVARVTDYRTRHERQASAGIYARLLFGLAHNQQYDEALACVTTIDTVAVTPHLLNAVLHVARHSRNPLSAFTFYKSVVGQQGRGNGSGSVAPTPHTISILLEAMCTAGCYGELDFLLREMRRHRVKGNSAMLNKLLEVLLKVRRNSEAEALRVAMQKKGIVVFDELRKQCKGATPVLPCS